jgi:hypothetical protein
MTLRGLDVAQNKRILAHRTSAGHLVNPVVTEVREVEFVGPQLPWNEADGGMTPRDLE